MNKFKVWDTVKLLQNNSSARLSVWEMYYITKIEHTIISLSDNKWIFEFGCRVSYNDIKKVDISYNYNIKI